MASSVSQGRGSGQIKVTSIADVADQPDPSDPFTFNSSHATHSVSLPSAIPSSKAIIINVVPHRAKPRFRPEVVQASPGDTLNFYFHAGNWSVVESTFAQPCQPKLDSGAKDETVIFSSFVDVEEQERVGKQKFVVQVTDVNTMWLYCIDGSIESVKDEKSHETACARGAVMVVNPIAGHGETLRAYRKAAKHSKSGNTTLPIKPVGGVLVDVAKDDLYLNGNRSHIATGKNNSTIGLQHEAGADAVMFGGKRLNVLISVALGLVAGAVAFIA